VHEFKGAITMKSICLLGCAVVTATCLTVYGASATPPPAPQTPDQHTVKPFDGRAITQNNSNMETRPCSLCHQPHPKKN
jgi:hypothetical protein